MGLLLFWNGADAGQVTQPDTTTTTTNAGGAGGSVAWRRWYQDQKPRKKRKPEDELDRWIAELKERVVRADLPDDSEESYQRKIRVSEALASNVDATEDQIDNQIAILKQAIIDIEDEELVLLLAA